MEIEFKLLDQMREDIESLKESRKLFEELLEHHKRTVSLLCTQVDELTRKMKRVPNLESFIDAMQKSDREMSATMTASIQAVMSPYEHRIKALEETAKKMGQLIANPTK